VAVQSVFLAPEERFSIPVVRKSAVATGQDPVTAARLSPVLKSQIEDWAKQQPDNPSRSEAIQRLVQLALAAKGKQRWP
jgi:hypothetical protein